MNWAFFDNIIYLVAVPVAAFILYFVYRRSSRLFTDWFRSDEYKYHDPRLKYGLRVIAILLLCLGLMGPYWGRSEQKVNVMGREVYVLLDISASMNAEDIKPNRLSKIKVDLKKLIEELKGDKIGLIVFTDQAFVQCPLTTDSRALNLFVDLVQTDQFRNTGTNFRSGLSMALNRFTSVEKSEQKITRSIILISDGEDHGDTYTSVVDRLEEEGIMVYTVGIGTREGAPVPDLVRGQKRGYKKNKDGKIAVSRLEDEDLKELASVFGTDYVAMDKQLSDLKPVQEQIKMQAATIIDSKIEQVENNRFQSFLLGALALIVFTWFWLPQRVRTEEENLKKKTAPNKG